eukprot:scaffold12402_cov71-Phaeocystis_antarctica.AAC.4
MSARQSRRSCVSVGSTPHAAGRLSSSPLTYVTLAEASMLPWGWSFSAGLGQITNIFVTWKEVGCQA